MSNITDKISHHIESQFPAIYREDGPELVAFMEAYYEFLENTDGMYIKEGRNMFDSNDIDDTLDKFVIHFKEKYLDDFPFVGATDNRFLVKHIFDYYRSKGSKQSLKLLLSLLYREDVDIYYPGDDVLRISDSVWFRPHYVEVTKSNRTVGYLNKQIVGSTSGATAFVEGIVTKRIAGRLIDVIYLSDVRGTFVTNEIITDDGNLKDAPMTIGSLSGIEITEGGRGNSVGDVFNVISSNGRQGKIRVTEISNATGKADFTIEDGGFAYTTTDDTTVYISDAVLYANNSNNSFIRFEDIRQEIVNLSLTNATTFNLHVVPGSIIEGRTSGGTVFANGTVLTIANTDANGSVIQSASANSKIVVELNPASKSFVQELQLGLSANSKFVNGETIYEESEYSFIVANTITGTFTITENVEQRLYNTYGNEYLAATTTATSGNAQITVASTIGIIPGQPVNKVSGTGVLSDFTKVKRVANSTTLILTKPAVTSGSMVVDIKQIKIQDSLAIGKLKSITGSTFVIEKAFGEFKIGEEIRGLTSNAHVLINSDITDSTKLGAVGIVSNNTNTSITVTGRSIVDRSSGNRLFNNANLIRGVISQNTNTISSRTNIGVANVNIVSNTSHVATVGRAKQNFVKGFVVGTNSTAIGIHGNTSDFYASTNAYSTHIVTDRSNMISPPRYANNMIIDVVATVTGIATGTGATFTVSAIDNLDTANVNIDNLSANNVADVQFPKIYLNGKNSGIGYVNSVSISNAGTGYTNNSLITFSGGGVQNTAPIRAANAQIVTTANTITGIKINDPGEGYADVPTVTIAGGGTGAVLVPVMEYGFGFEKNPYSNANTLLIDAMTFQNFTVGSIKTLSGINPGSNYNTNPFVSIYNKYTASYNRRGYYIEFSELTGAFFKDDIITQTIPNYNGSGITKVAKGKVVSSQVFQSGQGIAIIDRLTFDIDLKNSISITSQSGSSAMVTTIGEYLNRDEVGDNALIEGIVITANGVISKVEVIDSGYGYLDKTPIELSKDGYPYIITGTTSVEKGGIAEGYWKTNTSHLNSEKKIQDNYYYQEYSYDIVSGISLNRYKEIIKKVLHVAGTELFGSVEKVSIVSSIPSIPDTYQQSSLEI